MSAMWDHHTTAAALHCVCRRATRDYRRADGIFVSYKGVLQGVACIVVAYTGMARITYGLYTYGLVLAPHVSL